MGASNRSSRAGQELLQLQLNQQVFFSYTAERVRWSAKHKVGGRNSNALRVIGGDGFTRCIKLRSGDVWMQDPEMASQNTGIRLVGSKGGWLDRQQRQGAGRQIGRLAWLSRGRLSSRSAALAAEQASLLHALLFLTRAIPNPRPPSPPPLLPLPTPAPPPSPPPPFVPPSRRRCCCQRRHVMDRHANPAPEGRV